MLNPRKVIENRLRADLGSIEEMDIKSAIICGEMGCGPTEQEYLNKHPLLRFPYMNRVDDPRKYCERLRKEYQEAIAEK